MDQKGLKIDQNGLQIVFLDQKYLFWSHSHFRTFGLFEYIRISAYLVFNSVSFGDVLINALCI